MKYILFVHYMRRNGKVQNDELICEDEKVLREVADREARHKKYIKAISYAFAVKKYHPNKPYRNPFL